MRRRRESRKGPSVLPFPLDIAGTVVFGCKPRAQAELGHAGCSIGGYRVPGSRHSEQECLFPYGCDLPRKKAVREALSYRLGCSQSVINSPAVCHAIHAYGQQITCKLRSHHIITLTQSPQEWLSVGIASLANCLNVPKVGYSMVCYTASSHFSASANAEPPHVQDLARGTTKANERMARRGLGSSYQNYGEGDQQEGVMARSRAKMEQGDRHKTVEKEHLQ